MPTVNTSRLLSRSLTHCLVMGLSVLLGTASAAPAEANEALPVAEVQHDGPVDFEQQILPLLRRNCLACHNTTQAESDLVLETPQTILKGGSEGPGVVPGKAAESLVFQLAAHQRESFMPPAGNTVGAKNLTPEELGLLKLWIEQGAKGEVTGTAEAIRWQPLPPGYNPIYAVAVSSDGRYVAAGRANQIFMYSVPSRQSLGRLTDPELLETGVYQRPGVAHLDLVQSLAFSSGGERLASGGYRTVKIWHREAGVRQGELSPAAAEIRTLATTHDGKLAAIVEAGGNIRLDDVATGQVLRTLSVPMTEVTCVAFSSDGARLVAGSLDKTVRVWNVADGQETGKLEMPSPVTAAAFVLDGQQIITAGADHILRTWPLPEGAPAASPQPIKEMKGHGAPITALAPVPTAPQQIVSASLDGTARQWDVVAGNSIRQYAHGAPLSSVAVRADGKRVATGAETGVTKLWNAENGQPIAELTSDSAARYEVDRANLAIELARRHVQNAKTDLEEAGKRKQAEADNAAQAAVEVVRAEQLVKQKRAAAVKPLADKEVAEKELAALQPELPKAEAAKQANDQQQSQATAVLAKAQADREMKTKAVAETAAALMKAQAETAAADKALAEAQAKLKAAQDGSDPGAIAAAQGEVKSLEEKRAAADNTRQAAEAAKATADQAQTTADKVVAMAEAAKQEADQAKQQADKTLSEITQKFKAAEQRLAQLTPPAQKALDEQRAAEGGFEAAQHAVVLAQQAVEHAAAEVPQLQARLDQREQELQAAEHRFAQMQQTSNRQAAWIRDLEAQKISASRAALEAQHRLTDAQAARDAARAALADAREKRRVTRNEQAQAVVLANGAVQAAIAAKEASEQVLADAQGQLKAAQEAGDPAKINAVMAEVKSAEEQKAAAEQSLAEAQTAAQNATNQAAQTNTAAQNVVNQAHSQLTSADNALGGAPAVAETAAAYQARLDQQLREAQAALAAAADEISKQVQTAIIQDLTAKHAEAVQAATDTAAKAKEAAESQAATAQEFSAASTALSAAADAAREVAAQGEQLIHAATVAKARADKQAADAAAGHKAAITAQEAADKALTAAQQQLQQAQDDAAKAVGQVTLQNAMKKKAATDKEAVEAATRLQMANSAQGAAEKGLADAKAQAQQMQEAVNKTLAHAQNSYQEAFNKRSQADAAAGGALAQAATANELAAAADAALAQLRRPVRAVAFSPSGAQLAITSDEGKIDFFSSETGEPLHRFTASDGGLIAATYLGENRLLTAAHDQSLVIWSSQPVWTLERTIGSIDSASPLVDRVTALDFSPTGDLLATGGGAPSRGGELKLWNVVTGELVREVSDAHSDTVLGVAFSPDGKYLATCGADRFMKVFEVDSGRLVQSFEGHTHHVLGVSWRADGRLLVTSGADNVVKVWDFTTGEQIRTIQGFEKEITAVTFLGVSDSFVITTGAKQVITRNTGGGAGPSFGGATDFMYHVRASQDGKTVAAGGHDSVLRIWDPQGQPLVTFDPPAADADRATASEQARAQP